MTPPPRPVRWRPVMWPPQKKGPAGDRNRSRPSQAEPQRRRGQQERRAARRAHDQGPSERVPAAASLGALARLRAAVGARGLPARLHLARALPPGEWRAGGAGTSDVEAGVRRSSRRPGKSDAIDALAVARATLRSPRCRRHGWPAPSARSGCWSTTATILSPSARASSSGCAGTCTSSVRSSSCRPAVSTVASGSTASAGGWLDGSRRCRYGSAASSSRAAAS
jgi:hypothetical protein